MKNKNKFNFQKLFLVCKQDFEFDLIKISF